MLVLMTIRVRSQYFNRKGNYFMVTECRLKANIFLYIVYLSCNKKKHTNTTGCVILCMQIRKNYRTEEKHLLIDSMVQHTQL